MTTPWKLRPLTVDDYAGCIAVWTTTEGIGDAPDANRFTAFVTRNAGFSQVAVAEDRVVGVLLASYDGIRGYFYRLAVDRAWRRHGLASALVAAAMMALRQAGAQRINLHIFGDNAQAQVFWRSQGWSDYKNLETWHRELTSDH